MKGFVATVTSKGQVTIPAAVRRHLKLREKDKVIFLFDESGAVRLVASRYPDLASLRGAAGSLAKPRAWQEIEEIAHEDHLRDECPERP